MIIKHNKSSEQKDIKTQEDVQLEALKREDTSISEKENVDVFDVEKIDFAQRQERRRGDRRRGYRRIDDRNLISRAQEEADVIKETAAKEGYREGLEKAESDILTLREKIANFITAKQEVFEYIAPDLLEISLEIAKKIIKREIEQSPDLILDSIVEVMNTVSKDETRITVKVNPIQVELVKSELPEYVSSKGIEAKINVLGDDTISEGGCILNTNNGIVDATLDTQLYIIKEALKGM